MSTLGSGAAASYISYNFARGGHCGSNILYSPIEEQKQACSPIFAIECTKNPQKYSTCHAKKSSILSTLCLYGDIRAILGWDLLLPMGCVKLSN